MEGLGFCCIVSVAFPVFLIVWAGLGERFKVPRRGLYMAASVPAFIVFLSLAFSALCLIRFVSDSCTPSSYVFERSFGFAPTPDVRITNSSWRTEDRTRSQYLEFYADQATIDRIVKRSSLQRSDRGETVLGRPNRDPSWWDCWGGPTSRVVYSFSGFNSMRPNVDREFGSEDEVLIYDAPSRHAYYRYYGSNR
jgi:hypothetical protein